MSERVLGCANHLGLYSEQLDPAGDLTRNYRQALPDLALISSAFNLSRALSNR